MSRSIAASPALPRLGFERVMLKPPPAPASCQGRFPPGASAFRLAGPLRCRLPRLRAHTIKPRLAGTETERR